MKILIYTAIAFLLLGAVAAFAKVGLPQHVQETVDAVMQAKMDPVVLTGKAIPEFGTELVLAYGEQATLPSVVGYIVLVDTREGVGTPLPDKTETKQTIMAFTVDGQFVGAAKVDIAFVKASLDQFDKERQAIQDKAQPKA